ncbi:MAG: hypothetical protein CL484_08025 [Acidobacteria bacterium]|nr:hypothetical protein [Acidobacteriota bacterium]|tara:strand:+ start:1062 stop:2444 length:1383 start_codon:yes stop_codon:yes gene_type:complete
MTLGEVARVVDGRQVMVGSETPINGFSIDSRSLAPGDLFVAIRGDRYDGHEFVSEAFARGACGALVSHESALGMPTGVGIVVHDTLSAFQLLARYIRRISDARVVAITGSIGKTTTKELTAGLLEARYRVCRSRGNLNNAIGLPLSLLELRTRPEVAVVELGMNRSGEISRLVEISEPDVRVWTNVAEVHSEFFSSIESIADAKSEILEGASVDTTVVVNAEDRRIMTRLTDFPGQIETFGFGSEASVAAAEVEDRGLEGTRALIRTPVGSTMVSTPLLGRSNLSNVLAAMTVAVKFEVPLEAAAERVSKLQAAPHRGQVHHLQRGIVLVDDSYNSNPLAVEAALVPLRRDLRRGRRVAVLGQMLELGKRSTALHRRVGFAAAEAGLGLLITVGEAPARAVGTAAVEAGLAADRVLHCDNSEGAANRLVGMLEDGDMVLVKGSRGVRVELVVERLLAECS